MGTPWPTIRHLWPSQRLTVNTRGLSRFAVNRHTRKSHIQRSFRTHCGTERQLGGAAAGPARSSRRKSTLLAVPSLLDEKELHDEKEFLQQMRAGPLDRRFPLFVGLRCMLFHNPVTLMCSLSPFRPTIRHQRCGFLPMRSKHRPVRVKCLLPLSAVQPQRRCQIEVE